MKKPVSSSFARARVGQKHASGRDSKEIYGEMMNWHGMSDMSKKEEMPFIPIVVTLVVIIGWALFMLMHVLFWSGDFNLFQNIFIVILSLIIVGCGLGILWMFWVRRAPKILVEATSTAKLKSAQVSKTFIKPPRSRFA